MKKLVLSTALVLTLSVSTSVFGQESKKVTTDSKIENSMQKDKQAQSKKETKKEVKTNCSETATKDTGCCSKNKSQCSEKQIAPPIKQRPSDHPALQQTFPGGKDDPARASATDKNSTIQQKQTSSSVKKNKTRNAVRQKKQTPTVQNNQPVIQSKDTAPATKDKKETTTSNQSSSKK